MTGQMFSFQMGHEIIFLPPDSTCKTSKVLYVNSLDTGLIDGIR